MRYGQDKVYEVGDKIRLMNQRPAIYGEILYFTCDEEFSRTDSRRTNQAQICYKRLPEEIFGTREFFEEVGPKLKRPMQGIFAARIMHVCAYPCSY
jgi:hypothetical protein